MRTTIDGAGRIVVPKPLRDELGLSAGVELDIHAVDGRLEILAPSRNVRLQETQGAARLVSDTPIAELTPEQVRDVLERVRR